MDENQNTNQTQDQNASDSGGIFGSFMASNAIPTDTQTQQMSDQSSATQQIASNNVSQNSSVVSDFDSVVAGDANIIPPTQSQNDLSVSQTKTSETQRPFSSAGFEFGSSHTQDSVSTPHAKENQDPDMKELESFGVTVVDDTSKKPNVTVFDANSQFKDTQTTQAPAQKQAALVDTQELEKDFSNTFSTSSVSNDTNSSVDALGQEEQKLKDLHSQLKARANEKKQIVKEGLERLKKEKETLGRELQEIKEIEEIATKISEKIKHLEEIDDELDDIEKQAQQELS